MTPGSLFLADEGLLTTVEAAIPRNAKVFPDLCQPGVTGCSGDWIGYQLSPRVLVDKILEAQYVQCMGASPDKGRRHRTPAGRARSFRWRHLWMRQANLMSLARICPLRPSRVMPRAISRLIIQSSTSVFIVVALALALSPSRAGSRSAGRLYLAVGVLRFLSLLAAYWTVPYGDKGLRLYIESTIFRIVLGGLAFICIGALLRLSSVGFKTTPLTEPALDDSLRASSVPQLPS
ncbi:MAG TPA: hypothetical protein VG053_07540 [Solirubrobacteraceae bacterium]|nr:hypothetical protein [Solirubrobacteraceae bacterium]